MNFQYIKEVLGVQQIIRPKEWEEFYILYGRLREEYLLLSEESYTTEHQELVFKIMQALNQKSYALLYVKKFQLSVLHNMILRSSAKKIIAFGENWQNQLSQNPQSENGIPFHKVFTYSISTHIQLKSLVTYCLSDFLSPHSQQKKRISFAQMNALSDRVKL